jgi:hypothetical protein
MIVDFFSTTDIYQDLRYVKFGDHVHLVFNLKNINLASWQVEQTISHINQIIGQIIETSTIETSTIETSTNEELAEALFDDQKVCEVATGFCLVTLRDDVVEYFIVKGVPPFYMNENNVITICFMDHLYLPLKPNVFEEHVREGQSASDIFYKSVLTLTEKCQTEEFKKRIPHGTIVIFQESSNENLATPARKPDGKCAAHQLVKLYTSSTIYYESGKNWLSTTFLIFAREKLFEYYLSRVNKIHHQSSLQLNGEVSNFELVHIESICSDVVKCIEENPSHFNPSWTSFKNK